MNLFGLQLAYPWLLLLAPVGCLVAYNFYRRKKNEQVVAVPSLFLLKEFRATTNKRTSGVLPPLRLLFESLIIVGLILALTYPSIETRRDRTAIVVDDSFSLNSMDSVERNLSAPRNLYQHVVAKVQQLETSLPNPEVFTLSGRPSDPLPTTPAYTSDGIVEKIAMVQEGNKYQQIHLITDKKIKSTQPEWLTVHNVAPNVIGDNLAIERSRVVPTGNQISVWLRSHASKDRNFTLVVRDVMSPSTILYETKNTLAAGESRVMTSDVISLDKVKGVFIELISDGWTDVLPQDNWNWLVGEIRRPTVGVDTSSSVASLGLGQVKEINFVQLPDSQKEWGELTGILVHKKDASHLPSHSSLFLGGTIPKLKRVASDQAKVISAYDSQSSITRYLDFRTQKVRPSVEYLTPSNFDTVIRGGSGAVVTTVQEKGKRHVFCGLDLLPLEPSKNAFGAVLLLNILKWTFLETFDSSLTPTAAWRRFKSDSNVRFVDGKGAVFPSPLIEAPGIVLSDRRTYAVNFYAADESDLQNREFSLINPTKKTDLKPTSRNLLPMIMSVILLLILMDALIFYVFKKRVAFF